MVVAHGVQPDRIVDADLRQQVGRGRRVVSHQVALLDEGGHTDEAGQALIRTLGVYPPGVWVKLQCGEIAMVLRRTTMAKAPVVVSLVGRSGLPLDVPAMRNTKLPDYAVTGALPPGQVKLRPNLDLLEKAA